MRPFNAAANKKVLFDVSVEELLRSSGFIYFVCTLQHMKINLQFWEQAAANVCICIKYLLFMTTRGKTQVSSFTETSSQHSPARESCREARLPSR